MSETRPPAESTQPSEAPCACDRPARLFCDVIDGLMPLFRDDGADAPDSASGAIPSRERVVEALHCLQDVLFPGRMTSELTENASLEAFLEERLSRAYRILTVEIARSLPFRWLGQYAVVSGRKRDVDDVWEEARRIVAELYAKLPEIRKMLITDVQAAYNGDPAATTFAEIMMSYPCMRAITTHRIAHELYRMDVPLIPRVMSEHAHSQTGIDIHPGAEIGESFFIDHGTGVVIGETTKIGRNVKLYQGVTLGAKSFPLDEYGNPIKGIKRHPTLEDDVIVYAGATILGGDTVIGRGAVIGSNVWIVQSVPPYSTVVQRNPEIEIRDNSQRS